MSRIPVLGLALGLSITTAVADPLLNAMEERGLYNPSLFEIKSDPAASDSARLREAFEKAQLLSVEQLRELEKESPEKIREDLLRQVDLLLKLADKLREQDNPEFIPVVRDLEDQASQLREASSDPNIKKKLIAATRALAPAPHAPTWNQNWKKFRKTEYYATGGALLLIAGTELLNPPETRWKGGIGPDKAIRNALVLENENSRERMDSATTYGIAALTAWSLLEPVVLAWKQENATLAAQSTLIDLEAYAVTTLLTSVAKNVSARERPSGEDNESFWSGHTAQAFTAAGLLCTHHSYMKLYGSRTADRSACWAAMSVASLVGLGRIAADKHHASDVAVGAAIGVFSGMILPRILHYGWSPDSQASAGEPKSKRDKRPVRFKFEVGTVGERRPGPAGFVTGTFW